MYLTEQQAFDKKLIQYLAEQVLNEPVQTLEKLGGAMAWNYEVNRHYILKLPKKTPLIQDWEKQEKINPILQKELDVKIPQPFTKKIFMSAVAKDPLLSMHYEKIKGICMPQREFKQMDKQFKEKYFDQLTHLMLQLHSIPVELFPCEFITSMEYLKNYILKKLGKETTLTPEFLDRLLLNRFFGFKSKNIKSNTLCHNDLHSGNICLDSKGNIIGLIDFDTLTRGDTFMEFRPHLYQPEDMRLLLQKYSKKSEIPLDLKGVKKFRFLSNMFYFFAALDMLAQVGLKSARKLKQVIQNQKEIIY